MRTTVPSYQPSLCQYSESSWIFTRSPTLIFSLMAVPAGPPSPASPRSTADGEPSTVHEIRSPVLGGRRVHRFRGHHVEECFHHRRVELLAALVADVLEHIRAFPAGAVGAVEAQGV